MIYIEKGGGWIDEVGCIVEFVLDKSGIRFRIWPKWRSDYARKIAFEIASIKL